MKDKTEELRDVFQNVTDSDTVTESQEASRGSLTDRGDVTAQLGRVVEQLRDTYEFRTDLDDETLRALVRAFYDGDDDAAIAAEVDVSPETVFAARLDLHLFRENDIDDDVDVDALRGHLDADDETVRELTARLDADEPTVRRAIEVLRARDEALRANDRYRDEFESILADADISTHMAHDVKEDGLDDATDGMEVDVDF